MLPRALIRSASLVFALAMVPPAARAAALSPLTPLADAELFVSPAGKPFRSRPGEPYPVVAWFHQADANKDGRIDRAEFRADAEAFFHELDLNHDGVVDEAEINVYERQTVPEISAGIETGRLGGVLAHQPRLILAQMGGGSIDPGGGSSDSGGSSSNKQKEDSSLDGAAPYDLLQDPEPVRSADRRLSYRITLADFLARADHNFDALDPDGRGYLTLDDLPQTSVQKMARPARRGGSKT